MGMEKRKEVEKVRIKFDTTPPIHRYFCSSLVLRRRSVLDEGVTVILLQKPFQRCPFFL